MPNASEILSRRKTSGPPTLTGSDVSTSVLTVTIVSAEESPPEWTAPIIVEFKPPVKSTDKTRGEINRLGLNKTNCKALIEKLGTDLSEWGGKKVQFVRVSTNNPQTKQQTWGLRVAL